MQSLPIAGESAHKKLSKEELINKARAAALSTKNFFVDQAKRWASGTAWREWFTKEMTIASLGSTLLVVAGTIFIHTPPGAALAFGGVVGKMILRTLSATLAARGVYSYSEKLGLKKQSHRLTAGAGAGAATFFLIPAVASWLSHFAWENISIATDAAAAELPGVDRPKILTRLNTDPFVNNADFPPGQGIVEALKAGNVQKAVDLLGDRMHWTPEQRAEKVAYFLAHKDAIIAAMNGQAENDPSVQATAITKPTEMIQIDGPKGGYRAHDVLLSPTTKDGFAGVEVKIPVLDANGKVTHYDVFFIPKDCNNYSYLGTETPESPVVVPPVVEKQVCYSGCDDLMQRIIKVTPEQVDAAPPATVDDHLEHISGNGTQFAPNEPRVHDIRVIHAAPGVSDAVAARQFVEKIWPDLETKYPNEKHFYIAVDSNGDGKVDKYLCVSRTEDGLEIGTITQDTHRSRLRPTY